MLRQINNSFLLLKSRTYGCWARNITHKRGQVLKINQMSWVIKVTDTMKTIFGNSFGVHGNHRLKVNLTLTGPTTTKNQR